VVVVIGMLRILKFFFFLNSPREKLGRP
jgi:hypothetical protein